MSNVHRLPDRQASIAEACEWFARIERGLSAPELHELREWLNASPRHAATLMEIAGVWDRMGSLSRLADLFPKPVAHRASRRNIAIGLAASVLVSVATVLFALVQPHTARNIGRAVTPSGYQQLFETAIGEHSTIRLPDGSELTLNTNSRVLADFDSGGRRLKLERGEAYIEVAHDAARPLTVWARNKVVRAVGTAFNVEITERERVEVIVTEGKVLIAVIKGDAPPAEGAWPKEPGTLATAGQRVSIDDQAQAIEALNMEEISVRLSWREGNLVFHDEPLVQALDEIARYTRVEFIITDEELKTLRVAGLFKAGDVEGLLQTLHQNFNISYERVGADKILLKGE